VTQSVTLGSSAQLAVEMRLGAEALSRRTGRTWLALADFLSTARLEVSSATPGVVLTEILASATTTTTTITATTVTTTTTLPPLGGMTVAPRGKKLVVTCTLTNPSGRKGASCKAQGFAGTPRVAVTASRRHSFNKKGKARLTLALNKAGKRMLATAGSLPVSVTATISNGTGASAVAVEALLGSRR